MTASNRGSALVGSAQAELMKDWYRACFSPVENEGGELLFGNLQLFVEAHIEVSGSKADRHRVILNLDANDFGPLKRTGRRLRARS